MIAVVDFGAQYNLLIARRLRELGFAAEVVPFDVGPEYLERAGARALVLSGGPASVSDADILPHPEILELGLPVLGICYGMQVICHLRGGRVETGDHQEYGKRTLKRIGDSELLDGLEDPIQVWMSHGDLATALPEGARVVAETENCPFAAVEDPDRQLYMTQFHPEVSHTPQGSKILENFVRRVAKQEPDWSLETQVSATVTRIADKIGDSRAVCGVSGGVDSTVAAVLAHRALGDRLVPIFVDHGMMRDGEAEEVEEMLAGRLGLPLQTIHAGPRFLANLEGESDPEKKRKIIGKTFIEVFEEAARAQAPIDYLIQGTLYPDVIESRSVRGPSATIKTHHNVGGLPERMELKLVEPLRELFKDEVRRVGAILEIDADILGRHPFPGPGLAVRILGDITEERIRMARESDRIFIEELRSSGQYDKIWQAFTVLLPVRTVGVMGDKRTYEQAVAIRAVTSTDAMTADWARIPYDVLETISNRIVNEVRGLNRVTYDITSKPPGTIEWE